MLIGELSRRCGLSRDTIRFYEKQRLIVVGRNERRMNNYKEYSEDNLIRLKSIKLIKSLGFTLNEVADVLDMMDENVATCKNMADKIEDKVKVIDEKIQELKNVRELMMQGLKQCRDSFCDPDQPNDNCLIIDPKDVNSKKCEFEI